MLNFDYYNPTRICFGEGKIADLAHHVPGSARVLILSGGQSAEKNGTLNEVRKALGQRQQFEFSGIEANPTYETLMQAVAMVKEHAIDFLLAVGGGSVIDGTKFIAAAAHFQGDPWQILEQDADALDSAIPFGTVLTLSATGSEMNNVAVITRKSLRAKRAFRSPFIFPQFSILDPAKTFSLPEKQLANGIVDSFIHVIEQYLTYPVEAYVQDRFAEGLLQTLIEIAPQVMNETDYNARANFMWSAAQALNGLIGSGVPQDWSTHIIGHELTALYGIDHARTLAIVLPASLHTRKQSKYAKLLQYAERVWYLTEGSEDEKVEMAITKTRDFFESLGVKTRLSDYNLDHNNISEIITQLETHQMTALGENQDIDLSLTKKILEQSL